MKEETSESHFTSITRDPWWVKLTPFLAGLWADPVFRRNYARTRVKNVVKPLPAFIFGFVISLIIVIATVQLSSGIFKEEALMIALIAGVFVPVGLLTAITYLRMFITCLTTTSIELRRDKDDGSLNLVFTTPKTDAAIYYAECLPSFMKGLEVINALLALLAGNLIPFVIMGLLWVIKFSGEYQVGEGEIFMVIFWVIFVAFVILSGLILMMLLFSLASGLYALTMPAFGSIFATLAHYGVVNWMSWMITGFLISLLQNYLYAGYSPGFELVIPVAMVLFKTFLVIVGCIITGRLGINTFAKVRRQGYYEPEHTTAAGLERAK